MPTVPLSIRPSAAPVRDTAAWLVSGGDPAAWIAALVALGLRATEVRILPLPRSRTERSADAALLVPQSLPAARHPASSATPRSQANAVHAAHRPRGAATAIPYGLVAGRLFVPVDAEFDPQVSDEELKTLLDAGGALWVLRPHRDLVRFDADEVLGAADLFSPKRIASGGWNAAREVPSPNARLLSILPESPPTVEQILGGGGEGIGAESGRLSDLPSAPGESAVGRFLSDAAAKSLSGMAKLGGAMARGLAALGGAAARGAGAGRPGGAAGGAGAGSGGGGGVGFGLDRLIRAMQEGLSRSVQAARNRQIERLMDLLAKDPERGLRFAIPFGGGGGAHRGIASPSSQLFERPLDFSLGALGGGGAADFWALDWSMRERLAARYRELATREMELGRHRRAAYIFAHLLGDLNAAAAALASGGHHREAAVLYRDRLGRPLDAAKCLEQGGLWLEAAEQYAALAKHEDAGRLLEQLERTDEARAAYLRAVEQADAQGNPIEAARLWEARLHDADAALAVLVEAWPNSSQSRQCLAETFALLGRTGRHEEAATRVRQARDETLRESRERDLVEVLADLAGHFPHAEVRTSAADVVRVRVAAMLADLPEFARRPYVEAVRRLVPEDRLLGRDCERFVRPGSKPLPAPVPPPVPQRTEVRKGCGLVHVRRTQLPPNVDWRVAQAAGEAWFAAGYRHHGKLVLAHGYWESDRNEVQVLEWKLEWLRDPGRHFADPLLAVDPRGLHSVHVAVPNSPALVEQSFPPVDRRHRPLPAGTPPGLAPEAIGAVCDGDGNLHVLSWADASLVLTMTDRRGTPVGQRTASVPDEVLAELAERMESTGPIRFDVPMAVLGKFVYFALGSRVGTFYADGGNSFVPFEEWIKALQATPEGIAPRLLIVTVEGARMTWDGEIPAVGPRFADDLSDPVFAFTANGLLVACDGRLRRIYETRDRQVTQVGEFAHESGAPFAVLPGGTATRFAVAHRAGWIDLFRVHLPKR